MRREEHLSDAEETTLLEQKSLQSKIWTALPGIVTKVDYAKFTLEIQPSIMGTIEDADGNKQDVNLPLLGDVPLLQPNAGGWHLHFPVKPGDEVLVIFASRCIDAWYQNGGVQKAMETRMHDLSDGFAILAPYSQALAPDCQGGYTDKSVILRDDAKQNYLEFCTDGNVNILHQSNLDWDTLGNADIYIKGNANLLIDGNVTAEIKGTLTSTVHGAVTLQAKSTLDSTVEGNVNITCNSNVTAAITGNLDASVQGNVTANIGGNTDATIGGALTAKASTMTLQASAITLDAPNVTCTGNVSIAGNTGIGGSLGVTGGGGATISGPIKGNSSATISGDVTAGGISLKSHVHSGVYSGLDKTGAPE